MYCALELLEMKRKATEDWEKLQKVLDARAVLERVQRIEKTINWCDTVLNENLANCAKERRSLSACYRVSFHEDRLGNLCFSFLEKENKKYANGKISECSGKEDYDVEALKEYVAQHCLSYSEQGIYYYCYGFGRFNGKNIIISVDNCARP